MPPTLTPQDFVAKWKPVALTERASSQSHFIDLCALLGQPTPTDADPAGTWYTFEKGTVKQGEGQGWADVWKRGAFAWEYKGKHAGLGKAYEQLLRYRELLENPPLLVASDIEAIQWPPGQEPQGDPRVEAIARAARELVEKRDRWLNPEGASEKELKKRTLTNLYNQRPAWLDLAHRKLDHAVLEAYGWPHDLGDEEILERLLALNLERAKVTNCTPPHSRYSG
jgi:hypothetical protein